MVGIPAGSTTFNELTGFQIQYIPAVYGSKMLLRGNFHGQIGTWRVWCRNSKAAAPLIQGPPSSSTSLVARLRGRWWKWELLHLCAILLIHLPDQTLARTHTPTTTLKSNKHLLNAETTPLFSPCKMVQSGSEINPGIRRVDVSYLARNVWSGCFDWHVHDYVNTLSTAAWFK